MSGDLSASSKNFSEALSRAREIASKIKSGPSSSGVKRTLDSADSEEPDTKKSATTVGDPYLNAAMDGSAPPAAAPAMIGGGPTNEVMMVPDKMVGLIIGRGGEQITRLQAECGAKIQMAPESNGMNERQCTITGQAAAIAAAKNAIHAIIASEPGTGGGQRSNPGGGFFEMNVPGFKVGLIIGKGGEMIKQMQEQSGAKIVIIQDSPEAAMEKPLRITGTPEAVEVAKSLVTDILNQTDERDSMYGGGGGGARGRGRGGGTMRGGRGGGFAGRGGFGAGRGGGRGGWNGGAGGGGGEYGGQATDYVQVPSNKCGLIIGKGGETIKHINQSTGAHCEVDKNAPPDARDKNFIIRGAPEAVERAKNMILEKLGGGSGGYGYGGGAWGGSGSGGYGGQSEYGGQGQAGSSGQADYSAEWADYYRSMGMTREAEAIEATRTSGGSTASAPSTAPAAPNPAAPAQNGGADYSQQWAEYYRSIGKLKEAEAIEAQMKTKANSAGGQQAGYPQQQQQYPGYYGNYVSQ